MTKELRLSLKTKWFEMTKAGIKTEDYREITPYLALTICQAKKSLEIEVFGNIYETSELLNL